MIAQHLDALRIAVQRRKDADKLRGVRGSVVKAPDKRDAHEQLPARFGGQPQIVERLPAADADRAPVRFVVKVLAVEDQEVDPIQKLRQARMTAVRFERGMHARVAQCAEQRVERVELHRRFASGERHAAAVEKHRAAAINLAQYVVDRLLGAAQAQPAVVRGKARLFARPAFRRVRDAAAHRAERTQRVRRAAFGQDAAVGGHPFRIGAPRAAHVAALQVVNQPIAGAVLREIESPLKDTHCHVSFPFQ